MTNDNHLDQTVCNLPFEVVTIYDNSSQISQANTKSNLPPSVNVKIRIRNKEDTGRRGIISVPRLTAINWPKRVRLVNSAQTIMSFNLALEPNSDQAQKKSNRRLFQMFKPGGCLSIHRDEDGYSYMPSTSQELKRKSASGIEDCESSKITGAFSLKKNEFSSSYSDTLKPPKTFLGKCKPGGCLDPPFGEDKYTYKPNVEDVQLLRQPVINTNSLQPDMNIVDVKRKSTSRDQKQNILFGSYLDTKVHENTATLVTYPSNLSSTKLKTKDSQNKKAILRMGEQMDLSRKLTNEYPEEYFIPTRKERPKSENSYDKYKYEEKEPKIKEAYVNKDYILKSQTPSELLSDALTITSESCDEPLKEKQIIRDINTTTQLSLKSEDVLNINISKDNVKTDSPTVFATGLKKDENKFLEDQNPSSNNNIPIIKHIFSYTKESKNSLYKPISRSSIQANAIQDIHFKTVEDINYEENVDQNNFDFKDKLPHTYSLKTSKEISPKLSKDSINQRRISLDNFEISEQNNILRQHQNVFNNEITNIKQQIEEQSEENNKINPLKVKKSSSSEYKYINNISGKVISNIIIKEDINSETDDPKLSNVIIREVLTSEIDYPKSSIAAQKDDGKSNDLDKKVSEQIFENIREPTNLLVQDLEFKDSNKTEQSMDRGSERTTEPIIDIYPSVSDITPKVTSLRSVHKILSLRDSDSVLKSTKNIDLNPKDNLFDNESFKSTHLTNDINNADRYNEFKNSFDTLKNTLSSSLITSMSLQKMEKDSINTGLKNKQEIRSNDDKLDDTDTTLIPKMLQLSYPSPSDIISDNHDRTISQRDLSITLKDSINTGLKNKHEIRSNDDKLGDTDTTLIPKMLQLSYPSPSDIISDKYDRTISQRDLSITTKIKTSKDTIESIVNVRQTRQEFNNFDSSTNKGEDSKINTSDSKMLVNISKRDILSNDQVRKPSVELTNNNIRSLQMLPDTTFHQESDKGLVVVDNFIKGLDKSESDVETSGKKLPQKNSKIQEFQKITPTAKIKKSLADNKKNIRSISSVAINFGFHTFTNEKMGYSIETFDPSTSLARYPQDEIVTIKSILKKNENDIKVEIDSETDLVMQIKSTRRLDGSGKLASNILNGYTNDRKDNVRVYSSEILLNKDKQLQETLKTVYETLITIENNIIKLKEEAESLGREQFLLKKGLFSKEIKPNRINTNIGTCSCLQREIGLE